MCVLFFTNIQFGYVHAYACALHGLSDAAPEGYDHEEVQSVFAERPPLAQAQPGFLVRFAERLALIFVENESVHREYTEVE